MDRGKTGGAGYNKAPMAWSCMVLLIY